MYNKTIPKFSLELTGLTLDEILKGKVFKDAIKEIEDWIGPNDKIKIFTWGKEDKSMILKNLILFKVNCLFLKKIYDIQSFICNKIMYKGNILSNQLSVNDTRKIYKIEEDLQNHNALSDAKSIALIYQAFKRNTKKDYEYIEYLFNTKYKKELFYFKKEYFYSKVDKDILILLKNIYLNSLNPIKKDNFYSLKKNYLRLYSKNGDLLKYDINNIRINIKYQRQKDIHTFIICLKDNNKKIFEYEIILKSSRKLKSMTNILNLLEKNK